MHLTIHLDLTYEELKPTKFPFSLPWDINLDLTYEELKLSPLDLV